MKLILIFLLLLDGLLIFVWYTTKVSYTPPSTSYPEIQELSGKNLSFQELKDYFTKLAEKKGAVYAYAVLRISPVIPNIDMHLLGHVVGEILYKQQGIKGIAFCTEDFRNACSHTIVIGLLLDKGVDALPDIAETCRKAPGSSGAYTMCYHGLGHGVLAYSSFDLKKAIKLCEKTSKNGFSGPEAVQCVGGTIMETISGGGHDQATWAEQRKIYLKASDPLYPCNSDFMPDEVKFMCYVYLTPHLFQVAGADLGSPTSEHFKKAFTYCNKIPKEDSRNFDSCYGGFGKEFVVLAAGRDIRMTALGNVEEEQFKKVYEWCKLADQEDGTATCIVHAVNSYYWGGENPYSLALNFCSTINDNAYFQRTCYMNLISAVFAYVKDSNYLKEFCQALPQHFQKECQERLT